MTLFQKKYDIKKTPLKIIFSEEEQKYIYYYKHSPIPYNNLNKKLKIIINKKNKKLLRKPKLLQKELYMIKIENRLKKLSELGYKCNCFEYLDAPKGTMSKEIEKLLNNLTAEEDILLGIHRIGTNDETKKIQDILINGLEITEKLNEENIPIKELKNNVSYYPDNKKIIKELMHADHYNNSKGSILIRIPDTDLTQNIFIIDSNGKTRLNPKYIVGYLPLCKNHHLEIIITANQIKKSILQNRDTFKDRTIIDNTHQQVTKKKIRKKAY